MSRLNNPVTIIIPARYHSTRFPGKPLALLAGKPLIQHVYERALQAPGVRAVYVATDHPAIATTVQTFGGQVRLIDTPCRTGTDRVAAAARSLSGEIFVNLQADEIPLHPAWFHDLIQPFLASTTPIGTLKRPIMDPEEIAKPSVVKVVTDRTGKALYFSRASIPYLRDGTRSSASPLFSVHLGVYIFRRAALFAFADLPSGILEESEQLEQLRALEYGLPIQVWDTAYPSLRIDTREELEAANQQWTYLQEQVPVTKEHHP
ncbi:MAG: 3-deoxy-manno-octulosonate cytidylyltransferase [Nitrospirae bacterium]|nr:MAG: 3-deoxy-manno-octulosonate cytidylyltransferase [Nitrospirota bacterium]